jgi:N-acetyltransferase
MHQLFKLDLQPILRGEQMTMRPLEPQDFENLFAVASDPLIWSQHPDPGRSTREGFSSFFEDALGSKSCLVVVDSMHRTLIGCSRYSQYFPGQRITIGYTFLARSYWGGVANAGMKRLMLRHAFTDVQVVHFTIAERNLRSRRAVEKLGAELMETEAAPRWGQLHVTYRLTVEMWARDAAPGYGPEAAS